MKKRDLELAISALGYTLERQGGSHEWWSNGSFSFPLPRHREINENTARAIIRNAKKHAK